MAYPIICVFANFSHVALTFTFWGKVAIAISQLRKNVLLLCTLLSETTPGEWFVHQNVVNYYWTFEANWLLQADLSSKVVLLASYSKQYSSTLSSQFVQSGLFTAPPLKIKILGHFLLLFAWIAPTSWQLVSTILDEPNIKSCNKLKISNFLLFIPLLYI